MSRKHFTEDDIRRNDLPRDVFVILHDLCYHHEGRDVWDYVRRAQDALRKKTERKHDSLTKD